MNINIQNSNSMSDKKKFWLVTVIYLIIFWILPLWPSWIDHFFSFFDRLLLSFNLNISFSLLYPLFVIPLVIICIYYFFIKNLNLKFKKILFTLFYIVLPYILIISFLFYAYIRMSQNFNPAI